MTNTVDVLQEILYCFTAAVMNVAGGAMAIDYYQNRGDSDYVKAGMAMGVSMSVLQYNPRFRNALLFHHGYSQRLQG